MWTRSRHEIQLRQGSDYGPALALAVGSIGGSGRGKIGGDAGVAAGGEKAEGVCDQGQTLHTTVASGNGDEAKSSPSIMELFDTHTVVAAAAAARQQQQQETAPAAAAPDTSGAESPLVVHARRFNSIGGAAGAGFGKGYGAGGPAPNTWNPANSLTNPSKTAPPSTGTGGSGGRASAGSVGGAERHGYLSFSEVQVDEDETGDEGDEPSRSNSAVARRNAPCHRSVFSSTSAHSSSHFGSREIPQRKLRKRARAWKIFLAVMQEHGLRVRKYHRNAKGWAHRVVKYDPSLPGLRWKSSKWWDSGGGQIPMRDVLDVERRGKVVWIKCLHLGTVGLEASLETDAVIFYLAMDALLDTRCCASPSPSNVNNNGNGSNDHDAS